MSSHCRSTVYVSSIPLVCRDNESHWDQRGVPAYFITYALFFTVVEDPQVPVNLRLDSTSSDSITVSYDWPYQQNVEYEAKYEHGDDPPIFSAVNRFYNIYEEGFEPATFYNVSVRAVVFGRVSPFSEKILAITSKIPGVSPAKDRKIKVLYKHILISIRELKSILTFLMEMEKF